MRILTSLALLAVIACGSETPDPGTDSGLRPLIDAGVTLDTGAAVDAGTTPSDTGVTDAGVSADAGTPADAGATQDAGSGDTTPDPQAAEDIASIRAAEPGPIDVTVGRVMVTTVRGEIGRDAAGFFVQATQQGPGLFIAYDPAPAGLTHGSLVTFRATDCADSYGQRIVTGLTGLEVVGRGDLATMVQEVSQADDLVSNLGSYEAEILSAQITLVGGMEFAGNGFVGAAIDTNGLPASGLIFRIPETLQAEINLAPGCVLRATGPMWRYRDTAQLSVYELGAVANVDCPGTIILEAVATRATALRMTFSRDLREDSLQAGGGQFSIDGLGVESASLASPNTVLLITDEQAGGETYSLSVDDTLLDAAGNALDPAGRSTEFIGFEAGLRLRITELSANISSGCDRIELVALGNGSVEGFVLKERTSTLVTFPAITVASEDRIVVHMNSGSDRCNPSAATTETQSKDELLTAQHASHVDSAWDVWSTDRGLTATDNVFQIIGNGGLIQDAVLVSDALTGTAAGDSERAAATVAEASEWTTQAGEVPEGGFVDDSFSAHAAQGLGDEATNGSTSLQRRAGQDSNHSGDWHDGPRPSSWGAVNP